MMDVNWLGVLLGAVAFMAIGSVWYSKMLFAKQWMKLANVKGMGNKNTLPILLAISFVAALVMNYVLAHVMLAMGVETLSQGLATAFWMWLGFVFVSTLVNNMYESRSFNLVAINSGYFLVSLLASGVILTYLK